MNVGNILHLGIKELRNLARDPMLLTLIGYSFSVGIYTAATAMPEGAPILNERGVVHGGFKVVGDKTVKLVTVHVVDKGRPLYDWVGK